MFRILAVNPGSTSTKLAIFEEDKKVKSQDLSHSVQELKPFKKIADQYSFRVEKIRNFLNDSGYVLSDFSDRKSVV